MDYQKMPVGLRGISEQFTKEGLQYNFFKCEHLFQGVNKNLDLLFLTEVDYQKASSLLEKEGYLLYMDESVEKYKKMYVKVEKKQLTAVHLHREVAWHGIITLDKHKIFARAQGNFPTPEDALLIHAAHALFENFKVSPLQKELLQKYRSEAQDHRYIFQHLSPFGWKKAFEQLVSADFSVKKEMVFSAYLGRFSRNPFLMVNPLSKISEKIWRSVSLRRRGVLIALSGVNGSGKTTLVNEILRSYQPITKFLHGQQGYYYGWDPFLPLTKLLSRAAKKKNLYQKLNQGTKVDLKKEAILAYNFVEYLARYLWQIYPALRKGKLVVTDRYFYDLYAQHSYAEKSKIISFLLRLFPKPDHFFVLQADVAALSRRDKNNLVLSDTVTRPAERKVHLREELEHQIKKYRTLKEKYEGILIETEKDLAENTLQVIQSSWPSLAR